MYVCIYIYSIIMLVYVFMFSKINDLYNYLNLYYQSLSVIAVGGFIRDLHEIYKVENPRRCAQWNLVSKGISLISGNIIWPDGMQRGYMMLPRKCFRYILECLQWLISGTSRSESPIIPVYLRYRIRLSSNLFVFDGRGSYF